MKRNEDFRSSVPWAAFQVRCGRGWRVATVTPQPGACCHRGAVLACAVLAGQGWVGEAGWGGRGDEVRSRIRPGDWRRGTFRNSSALGTLCPLEHALSLSEPQRMWRWNRCVKFIIGLVSIVEKQDVHLELADPQHPDTSGSSSPSCHHAQVTWPSRRPREAQGLTLAPRFPE